MKTAQLRRPRGKRIERFAIDLALKELRDTAYLASCIGDGPLAANYNQGRLCGVATALMLLGVIDSAEYRRVLNLDKALHASGVEAANEQLRIVGLPRIGGGA